MAAKDFQSRKISLLEKPLHPNNIVFTKRDIVERAELSRKQIKKGYFLSQKALETKAKNW